MEVNVQIYCGNGRIAINLGDVVIAVEVNIYIHMYFISKFKR